MRRGSSFVPFLLVFPSLTCPSASPLWWPPAISTLLLLAAAIQTPILAANLSPCFLSCPHSMYSLVAEWSFKTKILLFPYLKPLVASRCIQNKMQKTLHGLCSRLQMAEILWLSSLWIWAGLTTVCDRICRSNVLWVQESHQESWSLGQGLLWGKPVFM